MCRVHEEYRCHDEAEERPEPKREPPPPREVIELIPGLPIEELELRLQLANRTSEVGYRTTAFYLADMQERRLYQFTGHASAIHYAMNKLGVSRRQARDLLAAGRALAELRRIDEAFCKGDLSWSKTRLLARIAIQETEEAWLERALEVTCAELEREVATSEVGRPPRKDRKGLPKVRFTVKVSLGVLGYEKWEQAKRLLQEECGERLTEGQALEYLAGMLLTTRPSGVPEGRTPVSDSLYRLIVQVCPKCEKHELLTQDGPVELDAASAAMVRCDAEVVNVAAQYDAIAERAEKTVVKRAFEKAAGGPTNLEDTEPGSEGAAPTSGKVKKRDIDTPKWLRELVLARDGFRCRCCGCRVNLMAHHIEWLSSGGKTEAGNLLSLCAHCHALVHEGLLVIVGQAPDHVRFLDRRGEELTKWKGGVGPLLSRLDGARAPSSQAPLVGAPFSGAPLSLEELPEQVDAEWWRRNSRHFEWNDRRGAFRYQGGIGSEEEQKDHGLRGSAPGDSRASTGWSEGPLAP
ncbi:MAG: HNH endonuclease signature motif containing protein [Planctomycetota bacterium]